MTSVSLNNHTLKNLHEARKSRASTKATSDDKANALAPKISGLQPGLQSTKTTAPRIVTLQNYPSEDAPESIPTPHLTDKQNLMTVNDLHERDGREEMRQLQKEYEATIEGYVEKRVFQLCDKKHWNFHDSANASLWFGSLETMLKFPSQVERIDLLSSDFTDKELLSIKQAMLEGRLPNLKEVRIIQMPAPEGCGISPDGIRRFNEQVPNLLKICSLKDSLGAELSESAKDAFKDPAVAFHYLEFRSILLWMECAPAHLQRPIAEKMQEYIFLIQYAKTHPTIALENPDLFVKILIDFTAQIKQLREEDRAKQVPDAAPLKQ